MSKKLSLLFLLFMIFSCGEKRQENKSSIDSLTVKDSLSISETPVEHKNPAIKHISFNKAIENLPATISKFVPEGYSALDTTIGDLNLDEFPDLILVLMKNGEDSTSDVVDHPEKRPLLILTGQPDASYKIEARNDNTVLCIDCGGMMGDPFMGITIRKGFFSVEHYGGSAWRWTRIITYKYSKADNNWYLHKDGGDSFHAADPDNNTSTVKTTKDFGKVEFEKFDIYEEQE